MNTSKTPQDRGAAPAMPQPTPAFDLPAGESLSTPAKAAGSGAAKGDDSLMSQPRDDASGLNSAHAAWNTRVGAARARWAKLSERDLLKTEGRASDLAALVQQHYGIQRVEADRQVTQFLAR